MRKVRSPLFYVGDKYKIMPQLKELFPENIDTFYDVFTGGGSASMAVNANKYKMNDINSNVIRLHKYLREQTKDLNTFREKMYGLIHYYGLTCSSRGEFPQNFEEIKRKYKKTYYAKLNKAGYLKLRNDYNLNQNSMDLLYLLLVFGFNHMTRFNKKDKFNLPVGNVDWNDNVENALENYAHFSNDNEIILYNQDFERFVLEQKFGDKDFLYFDPPYLITFSEYNKLWNDETENRLYNLLDELNKKKINWGLSNVFTHKGKKNNILQNWVSKNNYYVYPVKSNYISRFDNTIKADTKEVFITNNREETC